MRTCLTLFTVFLFFFFYEFHYNLMYRNFDRFKMPYVLFGSTSQDIQNVRLLFIKFNRIYCFFSCLENGGVAVFIKEELQENHSDSGEFKRIFLFHPIPHLTRDIILLNVCPKCYQIICKLNEFSSYKPKPKKISSSFVLEL